VTWILDAHADRAGCADRAGHQQRMGRAAEDARRSASASTRVAGEERASWLRGGLRRTGCRRRDRVRRAGSVSAGSSAASRRPERAQVWEIGPEVVAGARVGTPARTDSSAARPVTATGERRRGGAGEPLCGDCAGRNHDARETPRSWAMRVEGAAPRARALQADQPRTCSRPGPSAAWHDRDRVQKWSLLRKLARCPTWGGSSRCSPPSGCRGGSGRARAHGVDVPLPPGLRGPRRGDSHRGPAVDTAQAVLRPAVRDRARRGRRPPPAQALPRHQPAHAPGGRARPALDRVRATARATTSSTSTTRPQPQHPCRRVPRGCARDGGAAEDRAAPLRQQRATSTRAGSSPSGRTGCSTYRWRRAVLR
jgi:hypothetical protein